MSFSISTRQPCQPLSCSSWKSSGRLTSLLGLDWHGEEQSRANDRAFCLHGQTEQFPQPTGSRKTASHAPMESARRASSYFILHPEPETESEILSTSTGLRLFGRCSSRDPTSSAKTQFHEMEGSLFPRGIQVVLAVVVDPPEHSSHHKVVIYSPHYCSWMFHFNVGRHACASSKVVTADLFDSTASFLQLGG